MQTAYGTPEARPEVRQTWTANGQLQTVRDAKGNLTSYDYDGFGRLVRTRFPDKANGQASSSTDYEEYGYDAASNRTSVKLRGGSVTGFAYDRLNRLIAQNFQTSPKNFNASFAYDNLGRLTAANNAGTGFSSQVSFGYDALGRVVRETSSNGGAKTMSYDAAGRRTRLTWPDGFFVDYDYLNTGEMSSIRERGATSGIGILARYFFDDLGKRLYLQQGNSLVTEYTYDPGSRLTRMGHGHASVGFASDYASNPAGQIVSKTQPTDLYSYTETYNVNRGYSANGLNQYTASGSVAPSYDPKGNLASAGGASYDYNALNQLTGFTGGTIRYDALGRMLVVSTENSINDYDGGQVIAELDKSDRRVVRRFIYGPNPDELLVQYEGNQRLWADLDERGSVIKLTDDATNPIAFNAYDEYGIPQSTNVGRVQYTGQRWIPSLGMYDYKARIYSPTLGRFLQPDPIGYGDGMNMYGYVGGDPVNYTDPSGLMRQVCRREGGYSYVNTDGMHIVNAGTLVCYYQADASDFERLLGQLNREPRTAGPIRSRPRSRLRTPQKGLLDRAKDLYCSLPSVGLSGTAGGYAGLGGGVSFEVGFDPSTGRLGVSAGINVGVGVGFSVNGSGSLASGRSIPNGPSVSFGANASVRVPGARVGVAGTIINTQGYNPQFNGVSAGLAPGVGVTANANLTARGGGGGQVLPSCK